MLWLTVYIITPSTPRERVETARKTVLPLNLRFCSQINLSVPTATVKAAILKPRNQSVARALKLLLCKSRAPTRNLEPAPHGCAL